MSYAWPFVFFREISIFTFLLLDCESSLDNIVSSPICCVMCHSVDCLSPAPTLSVSIWNASQICMASLHRGHADLCCFNFSICAAEVSALFTLLMVSFEAQKLLIWMLPVYFFLTCNLALQLRPCLTQDHEDLHRFLLKVLQYQLLLFIYLLFSIQICYLFGVNFWVLCKEGVPTLLVFCQGVSACSNTIC